MKETRDVKFLDAQSVVVPEEKKPGRAWFSRVSDTVTTILDVCRDLAGEVYCAQDDIKALEIKVLALDEEIRLMRADIAWLKARADRL